ncbi:MAG TPA: hypothetical protein VIW46_05455 [Acidimicrobiia bacterium]
MTFAGSSWWQRNFFHIESMREVLHRVITVAARNRVIQARPLPHPIGDFV